MQCTGPPSGRGHSHSHVRTRSVRITVLTHTHTQRSCSVRNSTTIILYLHGLRLMAWLSWGRIIYKRGVDQRQSPPAVALHVTNRKVNYKLYPWIKRSRRRGRHSLFLAPPACRAAKVNDVSTYQLQAVLALCFNIEISKYRRVSTFLHPKIRFSFLPYIYGIDRYGPVVTL